MRRRASVEAAAPHWPRHRQDTAPPVPEHRWGVSMVLVRRISLVGAVCDVVCMGEYRLKFWPPGRRGTRLARGYLIALVVFVVMGAFFEVVYRLYPTDEIDFYGQVNLYTGVAVSPDGKSCSGQGTYADL